jgi:hypothetical protein
MKKICTFIFFAIFSPGQNGKIQTSILGFWVKCPSTLLLAHFEKKSNREFNEQAILYFSRWKWVANLNLDVTWVC